MFPVLWQMEEARYRMRELEIQADNDRIYRELMKGHPTLSETCCNWLGALLIKMGQWLTHKPLTPQAIKH